MTHDKLFEVAKSFSSHAIKQVAVLYEDGIEATFWVSETGEVENIETTSDESWTKKYGYPPKQ